MGQVGGMMDDVGSNSWGDLSGGEKGLKLGLGAGKGLLSGLANQQQQQRPMGGPPAQIPMAMQPQVSLPTEGVQMPGAPMGPGTGQQSSLRARNPMFYGYGQGQ